VQVEYDPALVAYEELVDTFWRLHNPTQLNRQGPDVGDQYRSVIFFHTQEQEVTAKASKAQLETTGTFDRPIATVIEPAPTFWRAEELHQRYLEKHGRGACNLGGDGW
jgi:peptide-methionine (S)-S-oxide reductase